MNMNRKNELKRLLEVSSINCVSTLQEINISLRLLQNSNPANFCPQNHMDIHALASSKNNQSFIPLLIFSFVLQR